MKMIYLAVLLAISGLIVLGCTQTTGQDAMEKKNAMMEKQASEAMSKDDSMMEKEGEMMEKGDSMTEKSAYNGKVLAGTASKYLDFSKADYDKALNENKKILLYFYANWCPLCKAEQPETFAAFTEINNPDLIGFRVNYRDSDTDADEEALAREFGIGYQHTKVILKDGRRVGKFPDSWDKQRYLDELEKV